MRSRRLGGASPGTGDSDRLARFEGVMTRARRRRCRLSDLLLPACTHSSSSSESVPSRKRPRRVEERRDWTNLAADIFREVAGRLCSHSPWPAAQYSRLRGVCKAWRDLSDNLCSMDVLFRPCRRWTIVPERSPTSRCRMRHDSGVRVCSELEALSSNYLFAVAEGLLVLRDKKSTDVVRLLNPLTGRLTEFPPITKVRAHDGSETKSRQAIDALKLYFSDPNKHRYFVGIDDSTSPPILVFCVQDNGPLYIESAPLHVVYAKPGDHHWVSVNNLDAWRMSSDLLRLAWYFRPPPGVCMPEKIYVYSFGFYY